MLDDDGSPERLLAETHLTERQVRLAVAYRDACPEEIGEAVGGNRRSPGELRTLYPFVYDAGGSE